MVVEDENQLIFFSNGMVVNLVSNGVISFDSSGQVKHKNWKDFKVKIIYYGSEKLKQIYSYDF